MIVNKKNNNKTLLKFTFKVYLIISNRRLVSEYFQFQSFNLNIRFKKTPKKFQIIRKIKSFFKKYFCL